MESAQTEVQRRQLLQFLEGDAPVWKDEDHPELAGGTSAWVHSIRREDWREAFDSPNAPETAGE